MEMTPTMIDKIEKAAREASHLLATERFAHVVIEPGDMTRYDFVIVLNNASGGRYLVATNFAPAYPWTPGYIDPVYATEKWGGGNEWTGLVASVFLSAVKVEAAR